MDRPVDAAAAGEMLVGGIDDGVRRDRRDVTPSDLDDAPTHATLARDVTHGCSPYVYSMMTDQFLRATLVAGWLGVALTFARLTEPYRPLSLRLESLAVVGAIAALLAELSVPQKAALCLGSDFWHTAPISELGIEAVMVSVESGAPVPE